MKLGLPEHKMHVDEDKIRASGLRSSITRVGEFHRPHEQRFLGAFGCIVLAQLQSGRSRVGLSDLCGYGKWGKPPTPSVPSEPASASSTDASFVMAELHEVGQTVVSKAQSKRTAVK